jgi:hypothetical protein
MIETTKFENKRVKLEVMIVPKSNTNVVVTSDNPKKNSFSVLQVGDFFKINHCDYWFICAEKGSIIGSIQVGGPGIVLDNNSFDNVELDDLIIAKDVFIDIKY